MEKGVVSKPTRLSKFDLKVGDKVIFKDDFDNKTVAFKALQKIRRGTVVGIYKWVFQVEYELSSGEKLRRGIRKLDYQLGEVRRAPSDYI